MKTDTARFRVIFKTYYATNLCSCYIWCHKSRKSKGIRQKYFEPPRPKAPPKVHIVEPIQTGERRITVKKEVATPYLMIDTTP
jgi:hypothetical protein